MSQTQAPVLMDLLAPAESSATVMWHALTSPTILISHLTMCVSCDD